MASAKVVLQSAKVASTPEKKRAAQHERRLRVQQVRAAQIRQAQQASRPGQRQDGEFRAQALHLGPPLFQGSPHRSRFRQQARRISPANRKYSKGPGKPPGAVQWRRFPARAELAISRVRVAISSAAVAVISRVAAKVVRWQGLELRDGFRWAT